MNKIKQIKNLFKRLIKDKNSVFYSVDKINRTLLNKSRTSSQENDKVFYKNYIRLEDLEIIYDEDNEKERIPFYTPFVEQKQDINRSSTLFSINGPMQVFHADIANFGSFSKSAVDPKYALLCVDLFSLKVYVYQMKEKIIQRVDSNLFIEKSNQNEMKNKNETAN